MPNEEIKKQNVDRALGTACACFLEHGVEFVTREMVSRESGISRASLGRYWTDKTDCVIQTTEWFRRHMQGVFEESFMKEGWETKRGIDQLRCFMEWCRELFREDPRIFALYTEFKVYLHRSAADLNEEQKKPIRAMGFRPLIREIYEQGVKDGSIVVLFDINDEVAFLGDAFFGYLLNLAFQTEFTIERKLEDIDRYIERMILIYSGNK